MSTEEKSVVAGASVPRPTSTEKYIGSPANGIDVFQSYNRVELQQMMAKQTLSIEQSRELRRFLEIAELAASNVV